MIYLLLSILCSTSLVVILRLFDKWKIKTEYGIVFNYLVCVITGLIAMDDKSMLKQVPSWNGWWICLLLGLGFILVFRIVGKSTIEAGVASTTIAFKLSFIIPVIVAVLFYGDALTPNKILGILLAIAAVILITYSGESKTAKISFLPLIIFVGSGITDSIFNFIQRNYTPPGFDHIVTIAVFLGAFLSGFILFGFKKEMYQWKNVLGGIVLGIPNYFSLFFLLKALKFTGWTPSILFPVNNLGIVMLSAVFGIVLFREHFNRNKIIGFLLALLSISVIAFWNS